MPTISVYRDDLSSYLEHDFTDDEYRQLLFDYGLELDEITSAKQLMSEGNEGELATDDISDDVIYKIDIPANRYDLLCLEGLGMAMKAFLHKTEIHNYCPVLPRESDMQTIKVTPNVLQIRPYVVAAVLRNITFTEKSYASFIELQEKLHNNLCRRRTLVAIGAHDLDTIRGPFTYDAKLPEEICFKPLNQTKEYNGKEIMELYANHAQLKQYVPIIRDFEIYPVISDSNGVVLSLPPIINGDHSKISLKTTNVFIECTATDLHKAQVVLETLCCMFSVYCAEKYSAEQCTVIGADGVQTTYPLLNYRTEKISAELASDYIGIDNDSKNVAKLLCKMSLPSQANENNEIIVSIPPTRHDIIHACDIYEDVAIAYGYNKISKLLPSFMHIADQFPLNQLTEMLRYTVAQAGFTEALTFTLCSMDDAFSKLNKDLKKNACVEIMNPKNSEFQVVRTSLLPGILKTIAANKQMPLPVKLFEIADILVIDQEEEVGVRNRRRMCAINCNKNAGFEIVHGLLDKIMSSLEVQWGTENGYQLRETTDPTFFPGRCAKIVKADFAVGTIGVLHPLVLQTFDINYPCSAIELDIDLFV
uniref:Phenylalanine--tRNA ligase beta subunit n=1 Tax=Tabanus bromius TaxID=304241 RepID=A0A0K8TNN3_TABBR